MAGKETTKAKSQRRTTGSRRGRARRRYVVLTNNTDQIIVLTHPDAPNNNVKDVVLDVRGSAVIDPDVWAPEDVPFLRRLLEDGSLSMDEYEYRPDTRRSLTVRWPDNPQDREVARQIVFTHDDEVALEHINMTPINENVAGHPVDINFLRTRQKPILQAALEAMKQIGDPKLQPRIEAIEARLHEIDMMPAA